MPASADARFFEERKPFLSQLHGGLRNVGMRLVIPVNLLVYTIMWAVVPCWQTAALVLSMVGVGVAWHLGYVWAARGALERGIVVQVGSLNVFCALLAVVREDALPVAVGAGLVLMAYAGLFTRRTLYFAAGMAGSLLVVETLLIQARLVPTFTLVPLLQAASDATILLLIVATTAYALRLNQLVSRGLFEATEGSLRRQEGVLATVQRVEPDLAGAIDGIRDTAVAFATRAEEQASASGMLSSAMAGLSAIAGETENAAAQTRELAELMRLESASGRENVQTVERDFIEAMRHFGGVRERVQLLAAEVVRTEEINEALRDIAENLKISALNASLEAVRAGEHGRGFSVVADDLRRMLQTTGSDLGRSGKLLEGIRGLASGIAGEVEASGHRLSSSVERLEVAADLIERVTGRFDTAADRVENIAGAAREQRAQVDMLTESVRYLEQEAGHLRLGTETLRNNVSRIEAAHGLLKETLAGDSDEGRF